MADGEATPTERRQEFIDEAHAEGLKIFAYYWHMSEKTMADLHREWICRDWNGNPVDTERGLYLDMTGPYRELVLTRLRELAGMGADGLFFDFRHLPPRGCLNTALAIAWEARMGAPPPAPNDCDPLYLDFLDFKAEQIEDTFAYWRDRVKADHPNVVFIISTTTVPALTDREMTTRLARLADSAKNEYRHALHSRFSKDVFEPPSNERPCEPPVDLRKPEDHVRQALGWTVLRDAADGRPPHIWARGVPNRKHAQAFAGSLLTFGCIANMDVHEYNLSEKTEATSPAGQDAGGRAQGRFRARQRRVTPHGRDTGVAVGRHPFRRRQSQRARGQFPRGVAGGALAARGRLSGAH